MLNFILGALACFALLYFVFYISVMIAASYLLFFT
jgi:hypothetical protein